MATQHLRSSSLGAAICFLFIAGKKRQWMEASLLFVFFLGNNLSSRCFSATLLILMSALLLSTDTEALRVIGGNVNGVLRDSAVLPCKLIDTTEILTQISWQRKTRDKPLNDDFYTIVYDDGPKYINGRDDRFKFVGNFSDRNGSLQLSNVTLKDEGSYTCIFTTFPSGSHETTIPLNVLVPPLTNLKDNHPVLGNEEVPLATCTAVGSRPPADVRWVPGSLEEKLRVTTNFTQHANGTTTTVSSLFGVPTREINHQSVQCVIRSAAWLKEETLPFTIQVFFSPMEVNITENSKHTFECVTEANPNATFTWTRSGQSLPQSAVRIEGAKLQFLRMTSDLNGLYHCEASNQYGRKHGQLLVHVVSGACTACWSLLGLLLILNVGAAAWYFYKSGYFPRTGEGTRGERQKIQSSSTSESVLREKEEAEELQVGAQPVRGVRSQTESL